MTSLNPSSDYYQMDGKLKIISISANFIENNPNNMISQCIAHFIHSSQCCHFNITCDGCKQENFMGKRYIPDPNQNIDFCESCYQKNKKDISNDRLKSITYPIDISPYYNRYLLIENSDTKQLVGLFQYTSYCNIFTLIYRYHCQSISISSILERIMDFIIKCVDIICSRKDLINLIDFKLFMYIGKDINVESKYLYIRSKSTKTTILDMKLDFEAIEYYNCLSFKKIDNNFKIREVVTYNDIDIQTDKQPEIDTKSNGFVTQPAPNPFGGFTLQTQPNNISPPQSQIQPFTFGGLQPVNNPLTQAFTFDKK